MIQKYLKDLLQKEVQGFEWSIDNYTGKDNTATVLMSNPSSSDINDERDFLFPNYQIYLRSSDFEKVEYQSYNIHMILNKRKQEIASREYRDSRGLLLGVKTYEIIFIDCNPPIRVGVEGKNMDYSINLSCTLREVKAHASN